jgi:integrase
MNGRIVQRLRPKRRYWADILVSGRKVALRAVRKVYQRALNLGSTDPEHYLFPFRAKHGLYDPVQPATRWFLRCSWNHLRDLSGFHRLRPHDRRHHAITRMLENGVDGDLVNTISGHISRQMREYYSHHRTRVRYETAQAIKPEYNVRKLVSEGRQRQKVEKKEIKANSQTEATQLSHSEEQAGKSSPVAVSDTRFLARFRGG